MLLLAFSSHLLAFCMLHLVLVCLTSLKILLVLLNAATPRSVTRNQLWFVMGGTGSAPDDLSEVNSFFYSFTRAWPSSPDVTIVDALSLWTTAFQNSPFVNRMQSTFNAEIFPMPYNPEPVNYWVYQHTNRKIENVIDKVVRLQGQMLIVDAMYFQGKFSIPFDPRETHDEDFTLSNGKKIKVEMMSRTGSFLFQ